ncbi:MAG: hypothetical protein H7146_13375 [Burkholderiaceae bacterium]|nr:hypothetical protein [Microbacteriaceae bacterium]
MDLTELTQMAADDLGLLFAGHIGRAGMDSRLLRRSYAVGDLVRVARGVYIEARRWRDLAAVGRHCVLIAASVDRDGDTVLSHHSAAALWGIPILGAWPTRVQSTMPRSGGGRSGVAVARHDGVVDDPLRAPSGYLVTSVARTVIDIARTAGFAAGVVAMDHAIHVDSRTGFSRATREEIEAVARRMMPFRGSRLVGAVMGFANGLSDSPGESLSRVQIMRLGFPAPVLQHVFRDAFGRIIVDFWWPDFNLAGEFDGVAKYHRVEYLAGRTVETVVTEEKHREDRLRRLGPRVARWDWDAAHQRAPLALILEQAGLPRGIR